MWLGVIRARAPRSWGTKEGVKFSHQHAMQLSGGLACTVHVTKCTYEGGGRAEQGGGRVSCALRHSHVEKACQEDH